MALSDEDKQWIGEALTQRIGDTVTQRIGDAVTQRIGEAVTSRMANLERLIVDVKESLERELHGFREEMTIRFDGQSVRLDRQAALIQNGSRWTARMNDWSEKIDSALEVRDKQISDLTRRIEKLEGRQPPAA
jgi:hypothetical protein